MVKIIFLADSHLGFDFPLRPKKEKRRRGTDFFNNFDKVLAYAKESKADLLIHGGDLFYRTLLPMPIVDMVYERIFKFAQSGIPVVIVPGNHESSRLPTSMFLQHPNIYYFSRPQVYNFNLKGLAFDIAGFPCIRKNVKEKFPDILKEIKLNLNDETIKLLCMHQTVEGAKVGPSDYTFRFGSDVIPIKDIPANYELILSGHIHRSQILWAGNKTPVIYPGSIERTAFAEIGEEKGFYEIVFNQKREYSYKFIELSTRPMIDIILKEKNYTKQSLKKEIAHKIKEIPSDSVIRFKMTNDENLAMLNVKLLDQLVPITMNYQISGLDALFYNKSLIPGSRNNFEEL